MALIPQTAGVSWQNVAILLADFRVYLTAGLLSLSLSPLSEFFLALTLSFSLYSHTLISVFIDKRETTSHFVGTIVGRFCHVEREREDTPLF